MRIIVLNGSPRKNGTVASLLKAVVAPISGRHDIEWIQVCGLNMKYCVACMKCREQEP